MKDTEIDKFVMYILCKYTHKNGLNITKLYQVLREELVKNNMAEKIGRPTVKSRLSVLTDREMLEQFNSGTSIIYKLSSKGEMECEKLKGKFH